MVFKKVNGYDYEVSDSGIVRSLERNITRRNGRPHTVKQKVLNPALDNKGYLRVSLSSNFKSKTFKVHRLVAEAFVLNENLSPQVNHKDGNKINNLADNLEWCTNSENIKHAYKNGLITDIYQPVMDTSNFDRGIDNKAAKLNDEKVIEARKMRTEGYSFQKIADKFCVNKKTIIHAIKKITWRHV